MENAEKSFITKIDKESLIENIETGVLILESNPNVDRVIIEPFLYQEHLGKKEKNLFKMFDYESIAETEKGREQEYQLLIRRIEEELLKRLDDEGILKDYYDYSFKLEEGEDIEGERMLGLTIGRRGYCGRGQRNDRCVHTVYS